MTPGNSADQIFLAVLVVVSAFTIYKLVYLRNEPYNAEWDKKLNELMDSHKFTRCTDHTAEIGGFVVWVANRPYSDFTPYEPHLDVSPSQKTLRRARARLVQDQLEELK